MTRRAIDDVLDHSKSRLATRLVLIALASYANEDGFAWPGMLKLMHRAGLARSTVWLAVNELLRSGEIRLHTGPVPGREHSVRSYTFLITVSGFEPLDAPGVHTVSGFEPLEDRADGETDTVSEIEPLGDAQAPASDAYFEHQGFEPRTSGVRSTRPNDPTPFQDSDEEKNRKGNVIEPSSEERAVARGIDVDRSEEGMSSDLAEQARVELLRCDLPDHVLLTRTLVTIGWVDGPIPDWLARQSPEKLADVIQRARDAQRGVRAS